MSPSDQTRRLARIVPPGEGRVYAMGRMKAVFKADGEQTAERCSVSEWWLEPRTNGPPAHAHDDDHVYYVIAGTLDVQLDGAWSKAEAGSYALIPGGTPHAFRNEGDAAAGFISFNAPGGFEARVPAIAAALSAEDLRL